MTILKYWNPKYEIALADWQTVYQFLKKKKCKLKFTGELCITG
jgi:hypothetical protein